MTNLTAEGLRALMSDIQMERERLARLADEVGQVQTVIGQGPERVGWFYELQALKLHNFYTGCERIFQLVASELNGGLPSGFDWHKRLLQRMTVEDARRPPLLQAATAQRLEEFLGFRHIVRNLYGFELQHERVALLLGRYEETWQAVDGDIQGFIAWLNSLAAQLESL